MKGQAMLDFIVEFTIPLTSEDQLVPEDKEYDWLWKIYINVSSNDHGSGAGSTWSRYSMEHFIKFGFKASKHADEYEAELIGMDLAKTIKVRKILINADSILMVG